jgi:tRNA pseudouridine32 synthase / 23S rRNA pseudouridine746 synthase
MTEKIENFIDALELNSIDCETIDYYYRGICPNTGEMLSLPRTFLAKAVARGLMRQLASEEIYNREGKMFGVLLARSSLGELYVLKAFSGLLQGKAEIKGWVAPISGKNSLVMAENRTLAALEAMKNELIALQARLEDDRRKYEILERELTSHWQKLVAIHKQRQQEREQQREKSRSSLKDEDLEQALAKLDALSRHDSREARQFKQQRDETLKPLQTAIAITEKNIQTIKTRRKHLSRQLQEQMFAAYSLTNFSGQSLALQELKSSGGLPTGAGDCCAPKLLQAAANRGLIPVAMAEFWWGDEGRRRGEFYGACAERCQPLMGFLLSGLAGTQEEEIKNPEKLLETIIYEDAWTIAINKPTGLLSVAGRYLDRQDSVVTRLRHLLSDGENLREVHRLDEETSGVLLLAKDGDSYRQLTEQFRERRVEKVYEAILAGLVSDDLGSISLCLWGDPDDRPFQRVNWEKGKPSLSHYRVIAREGNLTRIEFQPITGRTHQLRVHAADKMGLGTPILGDRLYGSRMSSRLHLHAKSLYFYHPRSGEKICLQTETPF